MKLFAKGNNVVLETERGENFGYMACVVSKYMTYSNYDHFDLVEEKIDLTDYEGNTRKVGKYIATIYLNATEKGE